MVLMLVSKDRELQRLCSEVLEELNGWTVSVSDPDCSRPSELTVWDFVPGMRLPDRAFRDTRRNLFVVDRKDLTDFRRSAGGTHTVILLKPITRPALCAFLGFAASAANGAQVSKSVRSDREEILQGLIQANLKLQEYEQDRTSYLARSVHDFRTPLMALKGYCGLLLDGHLGPLSERQAGVIRRMLHSATRLSGMASGMLQLSVPRRLDRPITELGFIDKCLEQALYEIAPIATDKRIAISTQLSPYGALHCDPAQIERVMINLLENACRFTPPDGSIRIRGYPYFWERRTARTRVAVAVERRRCSIREPNTYRVDISDSGDVIPPEQMRTLFEEYSSYDSGSDRSGSGLGLAICRDILNRHEGRVWVSNTDSGPVFSFVLPLRGAPVADAIKIAEPIETAGAQF